MVQNLICIDYRFKYILGIVLFGIWNLKYMYCHSKDLKILKT